MAQSGYTPISLYYTTTAAAVPTSGNLVAGELALNTNDGKLYYKNSSGVVTLLAGATAGPAGGSTTQVQYNNAGVLAGITGATTNGTALTLSSALTYGGVTLSNSVTGTGSMMLSASPTTTGTLTAAAINASGSISGTGTNTWTLGSVAATGSLVAGGWLYGTNNGLNFSPNGAGLAKRLTMSYYEAGGGTYREAIGFSNVASGNATVDILSAGGTTNVGGTLSVSGTSTMAAINASGIFTGTGGANIFTSSNSGAANSLTIKNTSNTSGADAVLKASVNSSAGGDPYLLIDTPAIVGWYVGSDSSNSSRFIIGTDVPGAADKLLITTAGAVSIPGSLGVTGAVTGTGGVLSGVAGVAYDANLTGQSNQVMIRLANSNGRLYAGVESSAAGTIISGDAAYDAVLVGTAGMSFSANNGSNLHMRIASTGAVSIAGTIAGTIFQTSTTDGLNNSSANPAIFTGINSGSGTATIIDANGRLYKLASSRRYKENIIPMTVTSEQLAGFLSIAPCFWDYKQEEGSLAIGGTGLAGFIAEDLADLEILRNERSVLNNYDLEGRPDSNRDAAIIGLQHLVLQDHEARLAALQAEFQSYKSSHP